MSCVSVRLALISALSLSAAISECIAAASPVELAPNVNAATATGQAPTSGGDIPNRSRASAAADEASAISSLRTMVTSQAMYYQGDVEDDGIDDYATETPDPDKPPYTDGVLGSGEENSGAGAGPERPVRQRQQRPPQ